MNQVPAVNFIRRFFEATTAEVAFEEFKVQSPEDFRAWKSNVVENGPPANLTREEEVRWGVYLDKLGLRDKYKLGRERDALGYR